LADGEVQDTDTNTNCFVYVAIIATLLQAHAASAKAGVDTLIRHVALEYGPFGIRANTIARAFPKISLIRYPDWGCTLPMLGKERKDDELTS
jgi:NAD(P)-dependent dehydrogenase (short-subunit alcohol dehydrogenase family)